MNTCGNCKHWQQKTAEQRSSLLGQCAKLSGETVKIDVGGEYYDQKNDPNVEDTGIESFPICHHDGMGHDYYTKKWFGCIHHEAIK